jgi:anaerobic selenocysteine-containing dehydrogenase
MKNLDRRNFLKLSAVSAGAIGITQVPFVNAKTRVAGELGKWVASTCQGCTSWCSIEGYIMDNKLVKVRGNANCMGNHGNICPRPHLAIQQVYDPDRIKTPLKRTNPKKGRGEDPKFVPISWDEAVNTIADKIMELINNDESHKSAIFRGRYTALNEVLYGSFPRLIGSPNNISHSAICAETEKMGRFYTAGYWNYPNTDILNTKYILSWGADIVASNRQVPHIINKFGDVRDNAKITAIDPRLSSTASKADTWLPIIPGEDGALAVAFAHTILVNGAWNKDFVGDFADGINHFKVGEQIPEDVVFNEKHTYGLIKWWNLELYNKTPQWAAPISGIPVHQIEEVALDFARAGSKAISWQCGSTMQVRGSSFSIAAEALNGLVGSVDAEGGMLQALSVPTAKPADFTPYLSEKILAGTKMPKIDQRGTKNFPCVTNGKAGSGVVTGNVANAMLAKDPYDLKLVIGYWCNFTFSISGSDVWERAMAQLPFYVNIGTHISEDCMFADIVLPTKQHMFERWGFVTSKQNAHSYLTIQQPMIKPLADAKTDETEVVFLIAQALAKKGYDAPLRYYTENFKDPVSGKEPTTPEEFDLYAVKMMTKPIWDGSSNDKGDIINSWDELLQKGVWNGKRFVPGKLIDNFKTDTKKFEFYSETFKRTLLDHVDKNNLSGVDEAMEYADFTARGERVFVPHYEPAVRYGDEKTYPLIFTEHKSRLNREGRSQNCTWYYAIKDVDPGDEAEKDVTKINPITAASYGLQNGDKIKISSIQGSILSEVKLWEGVRPGVITKCYGQGHWAYGSVGSKKFGSEPRGGNNNALMVHAFDRLTGTIVRHGGHTRVKIEKV